MQPFAAELTRYFEGFDNLSEEQKEFVAACLELWSASGWLGIITDMGRRAMLSHPPEDRIARATTYSALLEEKRKPGVDRLTLGCGFK